MKRQSEIAYLPKWNANDDGDNELDYDIIYFDMQPTNLESNAVMHCK